MHIKKVTPVWCYRGAIIHLKTIKELKKEFPGHNKDSNYDCYMMHDDWQYYIADEMVESFGRFIKLTSKVADEYAYCWNCEGDKFAWDLQHWVKGYVVC